MSEPIRPDPRPGEVYSVWLDFRGTWGPCLVTAVDECWVTLITQAAPGVPAGIQIRPHIHLWRHWPGMGIRPIPAPGAPRDGRDAPVPHSDTPTSQNRK